MLPLSLAPVPMPPSLGPLSCVAAGFITHVNNWASSHIDIASPVHCVIILFPFVCCRRAHHIGVTFLGYHSSTHEKDGDQSQRSRGRKQNKALLRIQSDISSSSFHSCLSVPECPKGKANWCRWVWWDLRTFCSVITGRRLVVGQKTDQLHLETFITLPRVFCIVLEDWMLHL